MDASKRPHRSAVFNRPKVVVRTPMQRRGRWVGRVFVQGLAAVLPGVVTLYLLWWLGSTFESILGGALKYLLPEGLYWPGMGVALGVVLIFAAGVALQLLVARHLYAAFEGLLKRVPVVRTIYGPVKDMMGFLYSDSKDKAAEQRAVRVEVPGLGGGLVGFVTREVAFELTNCPEDEDRVAVYLPMSYQIGGYMVLLPRSAVQPLDMGMQDVLRLTMTAGMARGKTDPEAPVA